MAVIEQFDGGPVPTDQAVLPGEQFSVGIDLTTVSGPSVVLDGVSAADKKRLVLQEENFEPHSTGLSAVDPLVAKFETCLDPTLGS